ncbi:hypothetical protein [Kitasatospora sp. NPDC004531]
MDEDDTLSGYGAGRELYKSLVRMESDGPARPLLDAWQARVLPAYPAWLARAAAFDTFSALSARDADLLECELFALARVSDAMTLGFQPPYDGREANDRPWLDPDREQYLGFFATLGMTEVGAADGFDPFLHEIAELVPAEDPDAPIELLDVLWPGLFLGELLFTRAGVRVRAGAHVAEPGWADTSPLYWANRRRGRRPVDLSHGWGSNSQWSTSHRMDFRTADGDRWNVVRDPERVSDHCVERHAMTLAEAESLVKHRCLLRRPAGLPALVADSQGAADLWPFNWQLPEPAECTPGCRNHGGPFRR